MLIVERIVDRQLSDKNLITREIPLCLHTVWEYMAIKDFELNDHMI